MPRRAFCSNYGPLQSKSLIDLIPEARPQRSVASIVIFPFVLWLHQKRKYGTIGYRVTNKVICHERRGKVVSLRMTPGDGMMHYRSTHVHPYSQEKMRGQRRRLPVQPLGYVMSTKVIFRRAEVFRDVRMQANLGPMFERKYIFISLPRAPSFSLFPKNLRAKQDCMRTSRKTDFP